MQRLPKPTAEEIRELKEEVMKSRHIRVSEVERLLSLSCGDGIRAVQSRLLPETSPHRRETPASVWRCWNLDFRGIDLAADLNGKGTEEKV